MTRLLLLLGLALSLVAPLSPGRADASEPIASADGFDHTYARWDGVLRKHVSAKGMVDYAGIKAAPNELDAFLASVAEVSAETVGSWTRDQQVAFYINAYNALTFRTIIEAMPVKSIRDISPDPWENSRWSVAGRKVSLNWIEHSKLRGQFGEARVHFVLVCAAMGCPRLPNRAILPTSLGSQLDAATKAFFVDPAKNRIDADGGKVYVSRIMEWYGDDFVTWKGTPSGPPLAGRADKEAATVRMLGKYANDADKEFLAGNAFTVVFNDYDWALNSQ
jgi:hypothetical protein